MAKNFQVTMFFKDDKDGWSESHVWVGGTGDSVDTVLAEAISAGGLCELRCDLLGSGAEFQAVRVSQDGVWRDSRVEESLSNSILRARTDNSLNNEGFPADDAGWVTRIRAEMTESYRGVFFLSGMPQALQPTPPLLSFPNPWNLAFNNYMNYLSNIQRPATKWGSFVQTKATAADVPNAVVPAPVAADLNHSVTPSTLALSFSAPLGQVAIGQRIRLLGVKAGLNNDGTPTADARKWNGRFQVVGRISNSSVIVALKDGLITSLPVLDWSNASGFLPTRVAEKYTALRWDGYSSRKRGRPFFARRGRR